MVRSILEDFRRLLRGIEVKIYGFRYIRESYIGLGNDGDHERGEELFFVEAKNFKDAVAQLKTKLRTHRGQQTFLFLYTYEEAKKIKNDDEQHTWFLKVNGRFLGSLDWRGVANATFSRGQKLY